MYNPIKRRNWKLCKVIGCYELHYAKGYCAKHWMSFRRNNLPKDVMDFVVPDVCIIEEPQARVICNEMMVKEFIHNLMKKCLLSVRCIRLISLRFGLEDGYCRNLEETGSVLNITRGRVGQIEKEALRKLRESITLCEELVL